MAAAVVGGGAGYFPEQWRPLALAIAGLLIGWLHFPRPGDTKTSALLPLLLLVLLGCSVHLVACSSTPSKLNTVERDLCKARAAWKVLALAAGGALDPKPGSARAELELAEDELCAALPIASASAAPPPAVPDNDAGI